MAVCSNSIRNSIEIMMEKSSLRQYLDFIVSAEEVEEGKPDPEIYNTSIGKLGLSPKDCLILEDNENGIEAAIASGAHLMKITDVEDVNYQNIKKRILELEG